MAADIARIPYSIGYTERSYVTGTGLGSAAVQNQAGNYVQPTIAAITADAAAQARHHPGQTSPSSTNPARPATPSPATAGSYSPPASPAQPEGKALTALFSWLTHAGQTYAAAVGYVPLPPAIEHLATATLARVTGPAGQSLAS